MKSKNMILSYLPLLFYSILIHIPQITCAARTCLTKIDRTDNFDILYKKKINNQTEDLATELEQTIYTILELFDIWEKYNAKWEEFNVCMKSFFKDFFGIRLIQNPFSNNTKKQLFINGMIEKIVYYYEKSSDDMKYKLEMQLNFLTSFRFDLLKKISYENQITIISTAFLLDIFFDNTKILTEKFTPQKETTPEKNIENTNNEENQYENQESENNTKLIHKNEQNDKVLQLMTEISEIGLLQDEYVYKVFNNNIIQALQENNFLETLHFTSDIFLEKIEYSKNNYDPLHCLNKLNKIYTLQKEQEEKFSIWLLNKEQINMAIEALCNEDYLFIFFVITIMHENSMNNRTIFSDDEYKLLSEQAYIAKTILDQLSIMANGKKINWSKIPKITINHEKIKNILSLL